jgi:nucleoside-diphosphate-sugar epimerase
MKLNSPPTLLITGGAGYIGSCVVQRAVAEGYIVHILDNINPVDSPLRNLFLQPGVKFFRGSITDPETIIESTRGVDYVIHLAGVSDGRAGKENPALTHKVNSESIGQLLTLSKAAGVKRFLFASTMGVYGNKYGMMLHEGLPLNPVDPYSESKAIGESVVRNADTDDFCTTSLRIAMVYGIGPKVREDFLVNRLCINAVMEGSLMIMGGEQKRPQIHVADLANLFLILLKSEREKICGSVFNAVESNPGLTEIVQIIRDVLPATHLNMLPAREQEDSFEMDGAFLYRAVGFRPAIGLKTGILEIINHYQSIRKN